jgi:hypothetical protein
LALETGFEALETSYGALESSFEVNFDGSRRVRSRVWSDPLPALYQTHCQRGSSQTHGLQWVWSVCNFFSLISVFLMVWVSTGVGPDPPPAWVWLDPRPAMGLVWLGVSLSWVWCVWVFFPLGISHGVDELIFISCTFVEFMRCHVGIGCCKMGVLHHDQTIGALKREIKSNEIKDMLPTIKSN